MVNHRWAIVYRNGFIGHVDMAFTRRGLIALIIRRTREFHLKYPKMMPKDHGLADAQLWRVIKRRRGYSVRRIVLKVAR